MSRSIDIGGLNLNNEIFIPVRRVTKEVASLEEINHKVLNETVLLDEEKSNTDFFKIHTLLMKFIAVYILICYILFSLYSFAVISQNNSLRIANISVAAAKTKAAMTIRQHNSFIDKLKTIQSQSIIVNVNGKSIALTSSDITAMLNTSLVNKNIVTLNSSAIISYFNNLAASNNYGPTDKVVIHHSDGTTAVVDSGASGFKVDSTSLNQAISSVSFGILNGKGMKINLSGMTIPFNTQSTAAGYNYLLESDVTTKRMYAYQDGNLVRTFLVTAGAPATPTPIGTFTIWQKLPYTDMRGFNPNGTKYFQPHVNWVMYFDHRGDAVHGNYWRPASVFGNVNTSHGCIGVTDSDAQWIYDWAPIGTTVVTHY